MTSPPFSDPDIYGNTTDSEPTTWSICPSNRTHMHVLGFQKKEGQVTLTGFEPPASQIRGNINQPELADHLQRTMLINCISENALINKITDGIINKLAKNHISMIQVT